MQRGDHNFKSTHKLKEFEPLWTDLEKESNNDEKEREKEKEKEREREREREDQYKKDTYEVLSGSKTFSHCFFFWFFFRTFYEALPWKCSNHPEKGTLSLSLRSFRERVWFLILHRKSSGPAYHHHLRHA
ncbi:unnamed protein product, partial [Brassica oleracea var. botrytis]